jgi:hypothetical protein
MILRSFYNGAFSIVSKHDFDDQFFFARDSISSEALSAPFVVPSLAEIGSFSDTFS